LIIFNKDQREKELGKYRMGLEVLRDAYTLVACGGFIGGLSQVSNAARYIKQSLGSDYRYKKTISKGISINGSEDIKQYMQRYSSQEK